MFGCGAELADAEPAGDGDPAGPRYPAGAGPGDRAPAAQEGLRLRHGDLRGRAGGVDVPVCYGPNLRALAVYLVVFQHVPVERAAALLADLTGATASTGWVSAQVAQTARALVEVEALIKTVLAAGW